MRRFHYVFCQRFHAFSFIYTAYFLEMTLPGIMRVKLIPRRPLSIVLHRQLKKHYLRHFSKRKNAQNEAGGFYKKDSNRNSQTYDTKRSTGKKVFDANIVGSAGES